MGPRSTPTGSNGVPPRHLFVVAAVTAACGGEGPPGTDVTFRDSAGVTIVEHAGDDDPRAAGSLRFEPEPAFEVGGAGGEPGGDLFRVVGAHRFSDGRIVVAGAGSHDLRFFGADGRHLRTVGAEGEGPGEFRAIQSLWAGPGDSLYVYDARNRAVTVFDGEGELRRSFPVSSPGGGITFGVGLFPDGSPLVAFAAPFEALTEPTDVLARPLTWEIRDPRGAVSATIGTWPSDEMFVWEGVPLYRLPFARGTSTAVVGDGVAVGWTGEPVLRVLRRDGSVERVIRLARAPRPVEPGAFERLRDAEIEAAGPAMAEVLADVYDAMPRHETYPSFGQIRSDPSGRMWIGDYAPPGGGPRGWSVLDPEGRPLGRAHPPEGLRILEIGSDYILGVALDELDVEHVRLHRLIPLP